MATQTQEAIQELDTLVRQNGALIKNQAAPALEAELLAGKTAIAQAITDKGVPTEPTDSLAVMSEKVRDITRQHTTIDVNEELTRMFFPSNIYNPFETAYQLRNTYGSRYKGIILAQYYKDFDSIMLQGSDAYATSDGDFYDTQTTHVWHDDDSGKIDRWIAYLYENDNYIFTSTLSGLCPRRIVVIGNCAKMTIDYNRLTNIYVPNGLGTLTDFSVGTNTPQGAWQAVQVIDEYVEHNSGSFFTNTSNVDNIILGVRKVSGGTLISGTNAALKSVSFPELTEISDGSIIRGASAALQNVEFTELQTISGGTVIYSNATGDFPALQNVAFPALTKISGGNVIQAYNNNIFNTLKSVEFPELTEISGGNVITGNGGNSFTALQNVAFPALTKISGGTVLGCGAGSFTALKSVEFPELTEVDWRTDMPNNPFVLSAGTKLFFPKIKRLSVNLTIANGAPYAVAGEIYLPMAEWGYFRIGGSGSFANSITDYILLGCKGAATDNIGAYFYSGSKQVLIEIGDKEMLDAGKEPRWKPRQPLTLSTVPMTAENIALKILDRLADNTDGDAITINIGATNLATINADQTYSPYVAAAQAKNYTIV